MGKHQGICFLKVFSSLNGSGLVPWAYLRKTALPKGKINARDIQRNINHKQLLSTLINAPSCEMKKRERVMFREPHPALSICPLFARLYL
jgi:hypothetical protein